jgi:hypothetical protein
MQLKTDQPSTAKSHEKQLPTASFRLRGCLESSSGWDCERGGKGVKKQTLYEKAQTTQLTPAPTDSKSPEMNLTQKQFSLNRAASRKQFPISL